jgi:hypothetical protein
VPPPAKTASWLRGIAHPHTRLRGAYPTVVPRKTHAAGSLPFARTPPALRTVGTRSSIGLLDYNGFFVKVQRRFANRFSLLNSYTLGRATDYNSDNDGTVTLTNIFDREYDRAPSQYDVTHTFSSTWIYELPWAAQRAYGGGS